MFCRSYWKFLEMLVSGFKKPPLSGSGNMAKGIIQRQPKDELQIQISRLTDMTWFTSYHTLSCVSQGNIKLLRWAQFGNRLIVSFFKTPTKFPRAISSAKENSSLGIKFSHTPYSRMYWNEKEERRKAIG